MALDYSKFKLSDADDKKFAVAPYDPTAGRAKMVARVTRSLKQFNGEQGPQGGKDYEEGHHDVVRYSPTLNGHRIYVDKAGEEYFAVARGNFAGFLTAFAANVDHGHYDNQIEVALSSTGSAPVVKTRATRNTSRQSALNIGVAAKRRAANPPSFDEIRKFYLANGDDAAMVDAAIAKRKAAEKA